MNNTAKISQLGNEHNVQEHNQLPCAQLVNITRFYTNKQPEAFQC